MLMVFATSIDAYARDRGWPRIPALFVAFAFYSLCFYVSLALPGRQAPEAGVVDPVAQNRNGDAHLGGVHAEIEEQVRRQASCGRIRRDVDFRTNQPRVQQVARVCNQAIRPVFDFSDQFEVIV